MSKQMSRKQPKTLQPEKDVKQEIREEKWVSPDKPKLNEVAGLVYTIFYTEGEGYDREWHIKQLIERIPSLISKAVQAELEKRTKLCTEVAVQIAKTWLEEDGRPKHLVHDLEDLEYHLELKGEQKNG